MYSVHVSSDSNRRSSTKRYQTTTTNRFNEYRTHQRRPSIRISNANQLIRYIRDNLFNLCSSESTVEEREYDEYDNLSVSTKPERIDVLCKLTKFTKRELKLMYQGFKNDCVDGYLREDAFKSIYQQFFPRGTESSSYAHFVFIAFDIETKGAITFTDFILGLSALLKGTIQEKLQWLFRLYDTKKKGFLEKDDFERILNSIYEMMSTANSKSSCDQFDEKEHLNLVFQKFDVNQTGTVSLQDFIKICLEDEEIIRSLDLFNTII